MGKLEAWDAGYDEGMFLDDRGYACECPGFNISAIKGDTLFTPSRGILVGITRGTVMEMARDAGLKVETGFYTAFDFTSADEVMMTNTVAGYRPGHEHRRLAHRRWQAGPVDHAVSRRPTSTGSRSGVNGTQVFPEAWKD